MVAEAQTGKAFYAGFDDHECAGPERGPATTPPSPLWTKLTFDSRRAGAHRPRLQDGDRAPPMS
jgi:hypothetical protein